MGKEKDKKDDKDLSKSKSGKEDPKAAKGKETTALPTEEKLKETSSRDSKLPVSASSSFVATKSESTGDFRNSGSGSSLSTMARRRLTTLDGTGLSVLLNNPYCSDVTFTFVEHHTLSAHSCVINARAPGLLTCPHTKIKAKKDRIEIELSEGFTFQAMFEILRYVYTGKVNPAEMKDVEIVQLLYAAKHFDGIALLTWICENHVMNNLNLSNIHNYVRACYDLKLNYLQGFCLRYAISHFQEFVNNKEGIRHVGVDIFQDVVANYANNGGKLDPLPPHLCPPDTFIDDLRRLYEQPKDADLCFRLEEASGMGISGTIFKYHKAIMGARSPQLTNLCNQTPVQVAKNTYAVIVPKGISPEGFHALTKWLYYGETRIPALAACELVAFCNLFGLPELHKVAVENMKTGIDVDTVLMILHSAHLPDQPDWFLEEMRQVKPMCIEFVVHNFSKINLNLMKEKRLYNSMAIEILFSYQRALRDGVVVPGASSTDSSLLKKEKKTRKKKDKDSDIGMEGEGSAVETTTSQEN